MKFKCFFFFASGLFFQPICSQAQGILIPNEPQEHIEVHKETDEHGNIIRFDSVRTWSYSSQGGNVNVDSLMRQMGMGSSFGFQGFKDPFFNQPQLGLIPPGFGSGMEEMMRMYDEMMNMHRQMIPSLGGHDGWIPAPPDAQTPPPQKKRSPKPDPNNPIIDM